MEKTKSIIDCFIHSLYFGGTRSVRVINVIISLAWFIALLLHSAADFKLQIPQELQQSVRLGINYANGGHHGLEFLRTNSDAGNAGNDLKVLLIMTLFSAVTGIGSLICTKFRHILKYVSLHAGALAQALISAAYTAYYPPLTMIAVTSLIMALWFLGAAYFVMEEPKNCQTTQKPSLKQICEICKAFKGGSNELRCNCNRIGE